MSVVELELGPLLNKLQQRAFELGKEAQAQRLNKRQAEKSWRMTICCV